METELKITISQFLNSTEYEKWSSACWRVEKREEEGGSMDVVESSRRAWIDAHSCRFI